MKKNLLFLILFFIASVSHAQKRELKGKVIDKISGSPLESVSILIDKSKKGTSTGKNGAFSLNVKGDKSVLIFSCVGYEPQTVMLEKLMSDTLLIAMMPLAPEMTEVVVVGYGSLKRTEVTGSISKFKDDKLDEAPVSRLDQALQGKIAGVQVENLTSEAGAPPKVTVRGISSIYAGASPLVVVDGQPIPDGLAFVNMSDIESVEVLKDAASAAIYGSRGASGVILITTKSGKAEKPKYLFKYSIGAKQAYKRYDVWTTTQYMNNLFYEAALKSMDPSIVTPVGTAIATNNERAGYVIENAIRGEGTDWQSQGLRTGMFQNISLTASGGKGDLKYFVSGAYQNDEGLMYKSNFDKFNLRAKVDIGLSKKVKLVINLNPSFTNRESPSVNYTTFVRYPSFMPAKHTQQTIDVIRQIPQWSNINVGNYAQPRHFNNIYYSGYMPDGSLWALGSNYTFDPFSSGTNSPISILNNTSVNTYDYRLHSSAELTVKLNKHLDFKSLATTYVNFNNGLNWANENAEADGMVSRGVFTNNSLVDLLTEETFTYNKTFGDHALNLLAGFTSQTTKTDKNQVTGLDFPGNDVRTYNNASIIDKSGTFENKNRIGLLSYLGRVNYNYKSKYLLTASFRTDGSSYFGPGKKWGTFPSVSVGWLMDKEKFMKKQKLVSSLKLRASYGVSGNNRILDFGFLDLLYPSNYSFGNGNGNVTPGQSTSPTIRSNPDITWESTHQANFGIDVSVLKNKISMTADYYRSETDRLLLQQSTMAFTGVPLSWNNIGSLRNTGFEIQINTVNFSKSKFKWTTAANFSHTKNQILELGKEAYLLNEGERNELYLNQVGMPLIQFYGFKTDGIWLSQDEINTALANGMSSPFSNAFVPGQLKLVDVNGDKVIDNKDRTVIGSPYPDFTWGLTNTLSYDNFDISFTWQGVQGGQLINGDPNYDEMKKLVVPYNKNRWISPMFPGDGKTPTYNKAAFNWMLTDYVVEDASYFSLREINIGYKIPDYKIKFANVSGLRIYLSAQNLYYHMAKGYRGINPENKLTTGPYASSLVGGYQRGGFPVPRTFVLGVDLSF